MKKTFVALIMMVGALAMIMSEADAKRLGGGGSIGRQSQNVSRQAPAAPQQSSNLSKPATPAAAPTPTAPQMPAVKPPSPWKGILGGALLGLGLGALLSHFGMGGELASMISSMLMIGLLIFAVMFIVRMFRGKKDNNDAEPAYASAYSEPATPEIGSRLESDNKPAAFQAAQSASSSDRALWGIPSDLDVPGFLRNAKTYFIRLQAAWDKADVKDVREFTSPEMFAELRLQLQERGSGKNTTDVMSLNAELLGVETVGMDYLASVKFSGMIKEEQDGPAEPFVEVWNLAKPTNGQGGWLLSGIQQIS